MAAREPSDAEVDAAFNDIVAHLTGREERRDSWADQHPLFAEPEGAGEGEREEPPDTSDRHEKTDRTEKSTPDQKTGDRSDAPDDGPVLRGEVLDPPPAADPEAEHATEEPLGWRVHSPPDDDELDELDLDELPRTPLPPWRPSSTAMAAMLLIAGSTVVTVLMIAQVRLPGWAGWAALVAFLAGMGLLFSRLPRDRDEDSDDGAVV